MFIDWVDGFGDWHTIPEPSYNQMQIIFHRLNQIATICDKNLSFNVAYDTNPQVEFYTHEILKAINLDPEELDMESINQLLIDPGLLLAKKKERAQKTDKKSKGSTSEELIAGLWLGCESLSDVMLLLDNFTIDQVMKISDARAQMRDPEKYRKNQIKQEAKQKVQEQANKFAEKHGIEIKGQKKAKNSGKTDVPVKERERRAKEIIERNKIDPKR